MKALLLLFITMSNITISYAGDGGASNSEFTAEVCGELIYRGRSYVLIADHQESYKISENKISKNVLTLTSVMRDIVMNHDYQESNAPQVCFTNVLSERLSDDELDVLDLEYVYYRDYLY